MNYYLKKTNELTEGEIEEIVDLLNNNLFKNRKKFSVKHFYKKYQNNFLGYSFHGLVKKDNNIIGLYFVLPEKFYLEKEFILAGQSVDTLIDKKFRGNLLVLRTLAELVYDGIRKINFKFVYGIPNENIYLIRKKLLGWSDITYMNLYFLLKPNFFQDFLLFINKTLNKLFNKNVKIDCMETKEKFIRSEKDELVRIKNTEFIYRTIKKNNTDYAYILKVFPSNKKNVDQVFFYLKKKKYKRVLFLSNHDLVLDNAFKLPKTFNKNKILLCGKILDEKNKKLTYNDLSQYKFNLINLDIMNPN